MPILPTIYLAFEEEIVGTTTNTILYNRGEDKLGNSVIVLTNGANIAGSLGRTGKVLNLMGTNARADAGYFYGHPIK